MIKRDSKKEVSIRQSRRKKEKRKRKREITELKTN
jgi:hypothetical protein